MSYSLGSLGNDTITPFIGGGSGGPPGEGNDTIDAQSGNDIIDGGNGDDLLIGGPGSDSIVGGNGNDWTSYESSLRPVTVDLAAQRAFSTNGQNDTLVGIEAVIGSPSDDSLLGSRRGETLLGGSGSDTLDGGDGLGFLDGGTGTDWVSAASQTAPVRIDLYARYVVSGLGYYELIGFEAAMGGSTGDTLVGTEGNECLAGGGGADLLDGGAGTDWVWYQSATGGVVVDLEAGTSSGADGEDILIGFENVHGSRYNDTILGDSRANSLTGHYGDDLLNGGAGDDTILSSDSDTTLIGGAGNDWLEASYGNGRLFMGGAGDDIIIGGTTGGDQVSYADASGSITVNLGASAVSGGGGTDQLFSITSLSGSIYNDVLLIGNAIRPYLAGDAGDDTLSAADGISAPGSLFQLRGGSGNDSLLGNSGTQHVELLYGDDGDDTLVAGGSTLVGHNEWQGGSGNDSVWGGSGASQMLYGGDDNDTLIAFSGANQRFYGNLGDDSLIGGIGTGQWLYGHEDNDTLLGGMGAGQVLYGGAGADCLVGGIHVKSELTGYQYFLGDDGPGSSYYPGGTDTLVGGEGTLQEFQGGGGNDLLRGGSGHYQRLIGDEGNDVLIAGNGDDQYLSGGNDDDSLIGGSGFGQQVFGESGHDTLVAGSGDKQQLDGGEGDDSLIGGSGNDTLDGGEGADTMLGGIGDDVFIVGDGDLFSERGGQGTDLILLRRDTISLSGQYIENVTGDLAGQAFSITGNTLANVLTGGALADTLNGGVGDDTLLGGAGNDSLFGGSGHDTLDGGDGADTIFGGTGNDVFIVGDGDVVQERSLQGTDTVLLRRASFDMNFIHVENVTGDLSGQAFTVFGNNLANVIIGGELADTLSGGAGDDTLNGGDGADRLVGGTGNDVFVVGDGDVVSERSWQGTDLILLRRDTISLSGQYIENVTGDMAGLAFSITGNTLANILTGGDLADTLNGGAGDDTLVGGEDNDSLIGGSGDDSFIFNAVPHDANIDTIRGYNAANDTILLDDAVFAALGAPGTLAADAFNAGAAATDADDRIIYNAATGALLYDADGLGGAAAVQFATLTGVSGVISNTEFLII